MPTRQPFNAPALDARIFSLQITLTEHRVSVPGKRSPSVTRNAIPDRISLSTPAPDGWPTHVPPAFASLGQHNAFLFDRESGSHDFPLRPARHVVPLFFASCQPFGSQATTADLPALFQGHAHCHLFSMILA